MKSDIHPSYQKAKVSCACGETFAVGSTLSEIEVEVCSACHPFYTGKGRLVDTEGRIDRFHARTAAKAALQRGGKKARTVKSARRREERAKRIEEK
ncbi:MAG: 50S ribosomal protein L31 [Candidatus Terrybacteria bacterium RIFCSPLOWO2_01_FULL_58_14]|uniref:Large ribosomal subunit protein bL31 n=2 Tax=Candidatus Terryibacteriota TaxID=1817920 RepID=A0A1G2PVV7_9BACT|nr:MAG: 50S ribosomal protein L31 [Candidatus Terrybacteria bacterium RIFCSPLOWO2_01_FULL_58_14]